MPWCTGCDRFLSPSTVTPTGECPRCGATVDPGRARAAAPVGDAPGAATDPASEGDGGAADGGGATVEAAVAGPDGGEAEESTLPIPWHFKLLVGAIALYLGWRAFQGIDWLLRQL